MRMQAGLPTPKKTTAPSMYRQKLNRPSVHDWKYVLDPREVAWLRYGSVWTARHTLQTLMAPTVEADGTLR